MNARELQALLQSAHPPQLIHVLPPEIHAAARIPGSQSGWRQARRASTQSVPAPAA